MRTLLLSYFFVFSGFLYTIVHAQNLVPNGDFENYSSLPNSTGDWPLIVGWNNVNMSLSAWPYATPDYMHVNGTGDAKLPNSKFASVNPHSGNAIVGLYSRHSSQLNSRDYVATQLTAPLVVGNTYTISFWMTSGYANYYYGSSCNHMGIQLSMAPLTQANHENTGGIPQAEVLTDPWLTNWAFYTFTYVATQPYQYITVGNFHTDAATTTTMHYAGANYTSGAYYFIDDVVVQASTSLPVELLSYDAVDKKDHVINSWQTNTEINNDYFTVERSTDVKNWEELGVVDAAGNSSSIQQYRFIDTDPVEGVSYYRLRQTDFDGSYAYSEIKTVTRRPDLSEQLIVFPNPADDFVVIKSAPEEIAGLSIYSIEGKNITREIPQRITDSGTSTTLDISTLPSGMYVFKTPNHSQRLSVH